MTRGRRSGRFASCAVAVVAALSLTVPQAQAETLDNMRRGLERVQNQKQNAQMELDESYGRVNSASSKLLESQIQLEEAQAILNDVQVQLGQAREKDAQLASALKEAKEELERAKAAVAQGEYEVEQQVLVIGAAARESYQQQTDLMGLSIVFGSETPADLSQRIQWNTTIFDTQAAEKARLDAILAQLQDARDKQAKIEAQIAADKKASEENVKRIADLEALATQQRSTVAALVDANEKARNAAQAELEADEAAYRQLVSEEEAHRAQIQTEIARIQADKAAAKLRDQVSRNAAALPEPPASASTTRVEGVTVSSFGFIRPVNANYGSPFGMRFHPILKYWRKHNGVDMGAPTGTPLYAAKAGKVIQAGPNGGFGNYVLIGHGELGGKYATTGYAHQSRIMVRAGQQVERGQLIGYVGSTGLSTSPHLHLELRLDGVPVNPVMYIP